MLSNSKTKSSKQENTSNVRTHSVKTLLLFISFFFLLLLLPLIVVFFFVSISSLFILIFFSLTLSKLMKTSFTTACQLCIKTLLECYLSVEFPFERFFVVFWLFLNRLAQQPRSTKLVPTLIMHCWLSFSLSVYTLWSCRK